MSEISRRSVNKAVWAAPVIVAAAAAPSIAASTQGQLALRHNRIVSPGEYTQHNSGLVDGNMTWIHIGFENISEETIPANTTLVVRFEITDLAVSGLRFDWNRRQSPSVLPVFTADGTRNFSSATIASQNGVIEKTATFGEAVPAGASRSVTLQLTPRSGMPANGSANGTVTAPGTTKAAFRATLVPPAGSNLSVDGETTITIDNVLQDFSSWVVSPASLKGPF